MIFGADASLGCVYAHQDLPSLRPKELNNSSSPCREFSIATKLSLPVISLLSYQEIGFRIIANLVNTFLVLSKTPKLDLSQCKCFPFLSWISLSGNRHTRCRGSLAPRIPDSRTSMWATPVNNKRYHYGTHHSLGFRGSSGSKYHNNENPEKPIPDAHED